MQHTLKSFTSTPLPVAVSGLLEKLKINYRSVSGDPINKEQLFVGNKPAYLAKGLDRLDTVYLIGFVNNKMLAEEEAEDVVETPSEESKAFIVFACDVKSEKDKTLSLPEFAHLTRALNRRSQNYPVILIAREGNLLSIATTERTSYTQEWRKGERVGKVCALRNINCDNPHPGHIDFLNNLGDKNYPTFDEFYKHWMEVFSCELLTEKFYKELYTWYSWAVQKVRFPNDLRTNDDDAKFNHEACIRLITRLIFVWFLKQKHLIPEEFFDVDYIRHHLIENFNPEGKYAIPYNPDDSKYYRLILQNLFFATLNCPIVAEGKTTANNRRFSSDASNFMHYESEFMPNGAQTFIKLANSCVPFLNGGLFDCLDKGHCFYDGFSELSTSLEQLHLPDYLFFNSGKGLVDLLKKYHFTIEENTPYNQEVSLDPELLGKVFENLLAAYTDAGQTARNETGSFYTPREIVQYMVNESLVAHLKRKCGKDLESQYRQLLDIATTEVDLTQEQRKDIMEAIYDCQVLDPACGSGAFPMGMLHQMVHVLKQVDPSNKMWNDMMINLATENASKELQRAATATEAEKERIEEDKQARLKDIEDAFNQSINDPDYARKLYLIENCIYGVDIQPIATQISKLRFFISLVVDQTPNQDAKNNFGIRPLPNLESKFVSANTLIPMDRSQDLFSSSDDIRDYQTQLQDLNHRHFRAKRTSEKRTLQEQMHATRMSMAQTMQNQGFIGDKGYEQLLWNMFDQNTSAGFFDPEWMFGVKNGFDVVIGNPPYLRIQGIRASNPAFADFLTSTYQSATGSFDLYACFTEKALGLIHDKGVVNYIMPQKWTNASFGKGLRKLVSSSKSANKIVDFGAYRVFNASTYTALQWFIPNSETLKYVALDRNLSTNKELDEFLSSLDGESYSRISNLKFSKEPWTLTGGEINRLLNKLDAQPRRLSDIFEKIFQGLATSKDDVYFLYNCIENDKNIIGYSKQLKRTICIEKEFVKPLLKGEDVHRYDNLETNRHVIFPYKINNGKVVLYTEKELSVLFPNGYTYLKECEGILKSREKGRFNIDGEWFQYGRKQGILSAEKEKLVAPDVSMGGNFAYDKNGDFYQTTTVYGYVKKDSVVTSYKTLMGILNSQLCWWFIQNTGTVMSGGYYRYKSSYLNPFPVPSEETISKVSGQIEHLVTLILERKTENNQTDISKYEEDINLLVYHLYNLTYDEVLIIDPDTSITREDYDNFKIED